MSAEKIALFLFSAALFMVALTSLAVGKTPYLGFFKHNFVARRRWERGYFWGGVAQYAAVGALLALLGFLTP